ncbi:MAG: hypothetical protein IKI57_05945 [Clostridia bacterium]|nr:hypothetical protein [Clostridia bacterium]
MKSFLRFILTVCIIGLIVFEVYYLINNNKTYKIEHPDVATENSGEVKEPEKEPVEEKEEVEVVDNNTKISISEIDEISRLNIETANVHSVEEDVGLEVIGENNKDFFDAMNINTTRVRVQTAGSMIHVMPFSDMLNEEEFHFDERGNLVLYMVTSTGKGDKAKYYLDNGNIIGFVFYEDGEEQESNASTKNESGETNNSGEVMVTSSLTDRVDIKEVSQRGAYLYRRYILKQGK